MFKTNRWSDFKLFQRFSVLQFFKKNSPPESLTYWILCQLPYQSSTLLLFSELLIQYFHKIDFQLTLLH